MLGDVLGFIGKGIDSWTSSKNAEKANQTQLQIAQQNIAHQKEFAQQGIRWRVDDAKAAGLHPLAALGAQTTSFSPVSVGDLALPKTSFGEMGQDIGRAIDAGSTAAERNDRMGQAVARTAQVFSLEKMNLENELLKTSIAKNVASLPPPFPPAGALAHLSRSPTRVDGHVVQDKQIEQEPLAVSPYKSYSWMGIPFDAGGLFNNSSGGQLEEAFGELGGSAGGLMNVPAYLANAVYNRIPSWAEYSAWLSRPATRRPASESRWRRRY